MQYRYSYKPTTRSYRNYKNSLLAQNNLLPSPKDKQQKKSKGSWRKNNPRKLSNYQQVHDLPDFNVTAAKARSGYFKTKIRSFHRGRH